MGLVHWFPLYLSLGTFLLWSNPAAQPPPSLWSEVELFLVNLVFPIVAFSGATYDGSLFAILFSMILFFVLAFARKRNQGRDASAYH